MYRKTAITLAVIGMLPAGPLQSQADNRCGWLDNPGAANFWLLDVEGEWLLSEQGGHHASGFFDLPETDLDFGDQWVANGRSGYGYGCVCLVGDFDAEKQVVMAISRAEPQKLFLCERDLGLVREQ